MSVLADNGKRKAGSEMFRIKYLLIVLLVLAVPLAAGVASPGNDASASQDWKAVVIVGGAVQDWNFESSADYLADDLEANGVSVKKFYSCDEIEASAEGSGWSIVSPALNEADIVVYFGHGIGFEDYDDGEAWGFCLDNDYSYPAIEANNGRSSGFIGRDIISEDVVFKENSLIVLVGACYSAGSSATDPPEGVSESVARKRIDAYADTFLQHNSAQAYMAGDEDMLVKGMMYYGDNLKEALDRDTSGVDIEHSYCTSDYPPVAGGQIYHFGTEYEGRSMWFYAVVGDLDITISDILPGFVPKGQNPEDPVDPEDGISEIGAWNSDTNQGFEEFVLLENPGGQAVEARCYLMTDSGPVLKVTRHLAPYSRDTLWLNQYMPYENISVWVNTTGGEEIICERSMYFNSEGRSGGSNAFGAPSPTESWYFAEGYTGGSFDSWILVENPYEDPRHVDIHLYGPSGEETHPFSGDLPPRSRFTLHVDEVPLPGYDDTEFSARVDSPGGVVAERAMYFDYQGSDGGHCERGATVLADQWYFAEGYTAGSFDTYILVWNPDGSPARVSVDVMDDQGNTGSASREVPGGARATFKLDDIADFEASQVSSHVTADRQVACERAMYFNYNGMPDGSGCLGVREPGSTWYFAEGCTADSFDTYILLMNPGDAEVTADLSFLKDDGTTVNHSEKVGPGSRKTVEVDKLQDMGSCSFSTSIVCDGGLLVTERAMYFDMRGKRGGHASAGVSEKSSNWYFAEGYTGD